MLSVFFFKIVGFYFYVDSKIKSAEISHFPQLPLVWPLLSPPQMAHLLY